jgi:hypothetical protein
MRSSSSQNTSSALIHRRSFVRRRFNRQGGLIKAIIIVVIALLVISYFGLNLREVIGQPNTQSNFAYAWEWVVKGWEVVKGPVMWVWREVIVKYIVMLGIKQQ